MSKNKYNNYKDVTICQKGCYNDKFTLTLKKQCKYNLIGFETKACILSYHITKDSGGPILCIYGVLITKINYYIEEECRKFYQVYLTSFNKEIFLCEKDHKVNSVTVSVENKFFKKIDSGCILGFFTLDFCVKICLPICPEENECTSKDLCTIDCCDTIQINKDLCDFNGEIKKDIFNDEYFQNDIQYPKFESFQPLRNDWMNALSSKQYNNRL